MSEMRKVMTRYVNAALCDFARGRSLVDVPCLCGGVEVVPCGMDVGWEGLAFSGVGTETEGRGIGFAGQTAHGDEYSGSVKIHF